VQLNLLFHGTTNMVPILMAKDFPQTAAM